ncbi:MAG: adenylosuccinate synthetase [Nanoarchaeota archaeon]|nr:adenylosuccinate synthetase [Nanoarchaeota archaeon]
MVNRIVVGTQWGDEGKGKMVDVLTAEADDVARFQGGANAGHTVEVGNEKFVLHLMPSGIVHKEYNKRSYIGAGVVVDPRALAIEASYLENRNIQLEDRLFIDNVAHVILPHERILDVAKEFARKKNGSEIGTTGRGIGPTYMYQKERSGVRMQDLLNPEKLKNQIEEFSEKVRHRFNELGLDKSDLKKVLEHLTREETRANQQILELGIIQKEDVDFMKYFNGDDLNNNIIFEDLSKLGEKFKPYLNNVSLLLNRAIASGRNILAEGAQGTFLDNIHGTYPYVTSSQTIAGAAFTGLGIGPLCIDDVIGVTKAYTTRVGGGPFPTELFDKVGAYLADKGQEVGASTGRSRRCGWLDAVMLRTATNLNGLTGIAITKLDVLSGLPKLKICTAYQCNGHTYKTVPQSLDEFARAKPIYEELDGWTEDISGIRHFEDLPNNAQSYVTRVKQLMRESESPARPKIFAVSVGPKRSEIIRL